jgi:hypothetical protein
MKTNEARCEKLACIMGEVFKGWRRKFGVLMLALACVSAGGWVRSLGSRDELNIWTGHLEMHQFTSSPMGISWTKERNLPSNIGMFSGKFGLIAFQTFPNDIYDPFRYSKAHWHTVWCGFQFAEATINPPSRGELVIWIIPYWSLTIPLTFISLFLLLPRPASQKQISGPIPEMVT